MLLSAQCRAGRALLDWSREQLADASMVGLRTVIDFARGARGPRRVTLAALRAAFEKAGVELIAENGGGPGVEIARALEEKEQMKPMAMNSFRSFLTANSFSPTI